jgi:hypothetical protein
MSAIRVVVRGGVAARLGRRGHVDRLGELGRDPIVAGGLHGAADVRERSPLLHLSLRDGRSTFRAAA